MSDAFQADLPVAGRPVLVVGGTGAVVAQTARLLHAGAQVRVVASQVDATVEDLAARGLLTLHKGEYRPELLDDVWLVVLAGVAERDQVSADARRRRLWCLDVAQTDTEASGSGAHVTLVGGGPGDPGLISRAGHEALLAADVVVYDRLAPVSLLAALGPDVELVDVGKIPRGRSTSQERINALLVEHARRGRHVVRLKGGDSFVFGRGAEEVSACAEAGIPVRVIPGITSAVAAPELAGIPVTHRGLSQGFTVVSGHLPPGHPGCTLDYAALARSGTTLVLLMAVANLAPIADALIAGGLDPHTPSAIVADAAMSSQRSLRSTVARIAHDVQHAGIRPPAVVVVGPVAALGGSEDRVEQEVSR